MARTTKPKPEEQIPTEPPTEPPVVKEVVEETSLTELAAAIHEEARISVNARITDPNGVEWQFTIRQGVDIELFHQFADICPYVSKTLLAAGWTVYGAKPTLGAPPAGKKLSPEGAPATDRPPLEEKPIPKRLSPAGTRPPTGELLGDSFDVTNLAMHWTDDHSQWFLRVFGGKYRKYGVRCWPEVAKDFGLYGLDLDALEVVGTQYDVSDFGFVVAFSRNDEGKVSKVTSIAQK
jgi:hypothetical protein